MQHSKFFAFHNFIAVVGSHRVFTHPIRDHLKLLLGDISINSLSLFLNQYPRSSPPNKCLIPFFLCLASTEHLVEYAIFLLLRDRLLLWLWLGLLH